MYRIPITLIFFRILLIPIVISMSYLGGNSIRIFIVILMYLGLLSDIFDGIIARRLGIATEKLRRLDSLVDLFFWLSIGISSWIISPEIIKNNSVPIIFLFILEIICYLVSFLRFKKEASTHSYTAKLWGLSLVVAFTSIIGFNYGGFFMDISILIGYISYADVILILLILPHWAHDIPSFYHAYLVRKNILFKKNHWFN
ncbi:CDP-alcohol phosphatidyltransferase family protein [Apibacter sp. HY039]|uniref:CDP-alcohol phosphatidyltransferase family protein n=1 Tax=Apibacter sp. HY039 TaxID=2501476 RepID=UPI000FEB5EAF|nr:CDP-alcohol phosphatidyltransferase family protein [Apibacter sp. HY039]